MRGEAGVAGPEKENCTKMEIIGARSHVSKRWMAANHDGTQLEN
jgi:hypothetical protein